MVTAQLPGGGTMLDRVLAGPGYAVLLDGASAFTALAGSPEDYVDGLLRELALALSDDRAGAGAADALGLALSRLPVPAGAGDEPSSTVSIVRWSADTTEVLVLGDSPVHVGLHDGRVVPVEDPRLSALTLPEQAEYEARMREGSGFDEEHRALVRRSQVRQFRLRNRPGGYWIAATDPRAAHEAVVRRFATREVRSVLLLSDGVSENIRYSSITTVEELMAMDRDALASTLQALDTWERTVDPAGLVWPRSKVSDDKSAVVLRTRGAQSAEPGPSA